MAEKQQEAERMVDCVKLKKTAKGLKIPPMPGALGQRIFENISDEAWQMWSKQQTMLINENRLVLTDARARQYLREQTEKFFFGEGADTAQGYIPPKTDSEKSDMTGA